MRQLFLAWCLIGFVSPVFAVIHPGPKDQIEERLVPFGGVCRPGDACSKATLLGGSAISTQETSVLSNTKVELSSGSEHVVQMLNIGPSGSMVFDPPVIKVSLGDTVTFEAIDLSHNSASLPGMIPKGADGWSGLINENISIKLIDEGVYVYQCDPHAVMAMVGVIQVGSPTNLEEIKQAAKTLKGSFAMNVNRLETYLSGL